MTPEPPATPGPLKSRQGSSMTRAFLRCFLAEWRLRHNPRSGILFGIFTAALKVAQAHVAGKSVPPIVRNERWTTCRFCPIYDPKLLRCRPHDASTAGCGCFVPFLIHVPKPYPEGCWWKHHFNELGGWL